MCLMNLRRNTQSFVVHSLYHLLTLSDVQLQTTDLQCDSNLIEKLASVDLEIYKYLSPGYPDILRDLAANIWCMFCATYLCEQISNEYQQRQVQADKQILS